MIRELNASLQRHNTYAAMHVINPWLMHSEFILDRVTSLSPNAQGYVCFAHDLIAQVNKVIRLGLVKFVGL